MLLMRFSCFLRLLLGLSKGMGFFFLFGSIFAGCVFAFFGIFIFSVFKALRKKTSFNNLKRKDIFFSICDGILQSVSVDPPKFYSEKDQEQIKLWENFKPSHHKVCGEISVLFFSLLCSLVIIRRRSFGRFHARSWTPCSSLKVEERCMFFLMLFWPLVLV